MVKLWRARAIHWMKLPLLLCFALAVGLAQVTTGSIAGDVKDVSGAYIPGAAVTVENPSNGFVRELKTNAEGTFSATALLPGTYTIKVSAPGFAPIELNGVVLNVGDHLRVPAFVLKPGGTAQTVEVQADSGQNQIQGDSGERSALVSNKQLNDLAMNGRQVLEMVRIVPGIVSTFNGAQSTNGGLSNIKINGNRGTSNGYTLEGVTNVDNGGNASSMVTINPDAIGEVKIITSNFQAEYGKTAGGQIAMTVRGGTNQYHGNARWFHRHEQFNAQQWFDGQANSIAISQGKAPTNPQQKYRYNYFGYQIGGPVLPNKREKLFFFFSQEHYKQFLPDGYGNIYVPTVDEINGDFSKSTDGYGNPLTVVDPTTGKAFPGNRIPDGKINQQIKNTLLKVYPRPNITDNATCTRNDKTSGPCNRYNYQTQFSTNDPRREDIGRLDYQISPSHRYYFTIVNNSEEEDLPKGINSQGTSNFKFPGGMHLSAPSYSLSNHLVSTLTPTVIHELTLGWSVNRQYIDSVNNNVSRSKYNLDIPLLYKIPDESPIPDFSFSGITNQTGPNSYLGAIPWKNAATAINFADSITKMLGQHTLKAGIFIERYRKDQSAWGNINGNFTFNGANTSQQMQTTNPYANALLGYYTTFQQSVDRKRGFYRYSNIEWYLQDNFKITHRLTLDYGMRFAWVQPQYDILKQSVVFRKDKWVGADAVRLYKPFASGAGQAYDPQTGVRVAGSLAGTIVPNSGNTLNGMAFAKQGNYPGGFKDRGILFQPRVGFAYDMFGNGNTVLRGGFGIANDRFQGNPIYSQVTDNPPNNLDPVFNYGNISDIPSLSLSNVVSPQNILGFDPSGKVPTVYSYSLGLQRNVGWGTMVDVTYVGNQGRHLSQKINLNAIPYGTLFTESAQDASQYKSNNYVVTPEGVPTVYSKQGYQYYGDKALSTNYLVKYPGYGSVAWWTWDGDSNYNSLQISINRRVGKLLTYGIAYTWAKAMDTSNSDGDYVNIINAKKYNYAQSSSDERQVWVSSFVLDVPRVSRFLGGSKLFSQILDHYQIEGLTNIHDGTPITPSADFSGIGGAKIISGSSTEGASLYLSGPVHLSNGRMGRMDPSVLAMPPVGVPSPWPQRYLRQGGTNSTNLSVYKNFPIHGEGMYLQLRVEAFNAFNHPQFYGVNLSTGKPVVAGTTKTDMASIMSNYGNIQVINPSNIRPSGNKSNLGQYFGDFSGGGNARIVQFGTKMFF